MLCQALVCQPGTRFDPLGTLIFTTARSRRTVTLLPTDRAMSVGRSIRPRELGHAARCTTCGHPSAQPPSCARRPLERRTFHSGGASGRSSTTLSHLPTRNRRPTPTPSAACASSRGRGSGSTRAARSSHPAPPHPRLRMHAVHGFGSSARWKGIQLLEQAPPMPTEISRRAVRHT